MQFEITADFFLEKNELELVIGKRELKGKDCLLYPRSGSHSGCQTRSRPRGLTDSRNHKKKNTNSSKKEWKRL